MSGLTSVATGDATGWIGLHGRRVAEQAAQLIEMFLVGSAFLPRVTVPFLFELRGGHGSAVNRASLSRLGMGRFYRKPREVAIPGCIGINQPGIRIKARDPPRHATGTTVQITVATVRSGNSEPGWPWSSS